MELKGGQMKQLTGRLETSNYEACCLGCRHAMPFPAMNDEAAKKFVEDVWLKRHGKKCPNGYRLNNNSLGLTVIVTLRLGEPSNKPWP